MTLFYELIQVALGKQEVLSHTPTAREWQGLFAMSRKQAVAGVAFLALDVLSRRGQQPPQDVLYAWIGLSERIRQQNLMVNRRCAEVTTLFAEAGFQSCILKGQGNARMYPVPESRQPGDIDLWVFGERREITRFVRARCPEAFEQYHHIDFPVFRDVPVEVHYTPGQLMRPRCNRRFQAWCRAQGLALQAERPDTAAAGFRVPSTAFNAVYQMAHMMVHFFIEGIGLRHLIDYYYVLTDDMVSQQQDTIRDTLCALGMERFARGVMWVEQYALGLEDKHLLFEPSEKVGRMILKEMEEGGNFGHHDERYTFRRNGMLTRGLADTVRLLRLAKVFPLESFWKIVKKIENQKWKLNRS